MNDKNISRRGVIRPTKIIFEAAARHFSNGFLNESIHSSIFYGDCCQVLLQYQTNLSKLIKLYTP